MKRTQIHASSAEDLSQKTGDDQSNDQPHNDLKKTKMDPIIQSISQSETDGPSVPNDQQEQSPALHFSEEDEKHKQRCSSIETPIEVKPSLLRDFVKGVLRDELQTHLKDSLSDFVKRIVKAEVQNQLKANMPAVHNFGNHDETINQLKKENAREKKFLSDIFRSLSENIIDKTEPSENTETETFTADKKHFYTDDTNLKAMEGNSLATRLARSMNNHGIDSSKSVCPDKMKMNEDDDIDAFLLDDQLLEFALHESRLTIEGNQTGNCSSQEIEQEDEKDESVKKWRQKALQEKRKAIEEDSLDRLPGRAVILCIDTSESMNYGNAWIQAKQFLKDYFSGIQDLMENGSRYDWIGIVTFGNGGVILQQKPIQEVEILRQVIDSLTPSGPSPMFGGLVLSKEYARAPFNKVCVNYWKLNPQIILLTDGKATEIERTDGEDILNADHITQIKTIICSEAMKCFAADVDLHCVVVGDDSDKEFMRSIQEMSHHRDLLVHSDGLKMAHFSTNQIAEKGDQRFVNTRGDIDRNKEIRSINLHEGKVLSMYKESQDWQYPTVGSRVRRGDDWRYGNQDKHGPGTIIGHDLEEKAYGGARWVFVEWDAGVKNGYLSSHLRICDYEERVPTNEEIVAVGCIVKPGPNFKDNVDDKEEKRGVVIKFKNDWKALVRWTDGKRGIYHYGKYNTPKEIETVKKHGSSTDNISDLEEKDLSEIALAIGKNWKKIGTTLSVTNVNMEHIEMDKKTAWEQNTEMLRIWKRQAGPGATLEQLFRAMHKNAGHVTIDWDKLERHFFPNELPNWYKNLRK